MTAVGIAAHSHTQKLTDYLKGASAGGSCVCESCVRLGEFFCALDVKHVKSPRDSI